MVIIGCEVVKNCSGLPFFEGLPIIEALIGLGLSYKSFTSSRLLERLVSLNED